jgi:hypothetical protein
VAAVAAIVVELGLQSCAVLARYPTRDAICRRVRYHVGAAEAGMSTISKLRHDVADSGFMMYAYAYHSSYHCSHSGCSVALFRRDKNVYLSKPAPVIQRSDGPQAVPAAVPQSVAASQTALCIRTPRQLSVAARLLMVDKSRATSPQVD